MALTSDRLNELIKYYSGKENRSEIVGALQRQLDEALARETNEQALAQALAQGKGADFMMQQNSPFYRKPEYKFEMPQMVPQGPDYRKVPSAMPANMQEQFYAAAAKQREIERQQELERQRQAQLAYEAMVRKQNAGKIQSSTDYVDDDWAVSNGIEENNEAPAPAPAPVADNWTVENGIDPVYVEPSGMAVAEASESNVPSTKPIEAEGPDKTNWLKGGTNVPVDRQARAYMLAESLKKKRLAEWRKAHPLTTYADYLAYKKAEAAEMARIEAELTKQLADKLKL